MVLQEHISAMLEKTETTPEEFLAILPPIRHAIGLMIATYNCDDETGARKIFDVCLEHLADESGGPKCVENIMSLAILRGIHLACERLLSKRLSQRQYHQAMHVSMN